MFTFRADDTDRASIPRRSDRFFEKESYWYYTTREGLDIGPFDTYREAQEGCDEFIEFITGSGNNYLPTLRDYGQHVA